MQLLHAPSLVPAKSQGEDGAAANELWGRKKMAVTSNNITANRFMVFQV